MNRNTQNKSKRLVSLSPSPSHSVLHICLRTCVCLSMNAMSPSPLAGPLGRTVSVFSPVTKIIFLLMTLTLDDVLTESG